MDRDISFGVACAALSAEVWNNVPHGANLTPEQITELCQRSITYLSRETQKDVSFHGLKSGSDGRSVYVTFKQDGAPPYRALFRWPKRANVSVEAI